MAFIAIAIPTYNRAEKLQITLDQICDMLRKSESLNRDVEILISNNASTDNTQEVLKGFDGSGINFKFYNQERNLGLDGNIRFLYSHAQSEYVWFFSDDDVLFEGAIDKVVDALRYYNPAGLLFSFMQPIGSLTPIFDYPQKTKLIRSQSEIIKLLAQYPKISAYIYKKLELNEVDLESLRPANGSNFEFIALGYLIFQKIGQLGLCVVSEPLAGCDEDFHKIRFSPETWGSAWRVFQHPYVSEFSPKLVKTKKKESYYNQIQALFAVKAGALIAENLNDYDNFIKELEFNMLWLIQKPRSLVQFVFLKLDIVKFWVKSSALLR